MPILYGQIRLIKLLFVAVVHLLSNSLASISWVHTSKDVCLLNLWLYFWLQFSRFFCFAAFTHTLTCAPTHACIHVQVLNGRALANGVRAHQSFVCAQRHRGDDAIRSEQLARRWEALLLPSSFSLRVVLPRTHFLAPCVFLSIFLVFRKNHAFALIYTRKGEIVTWPASTQPLFAPGLTNIIAAMDLKWPNNHRVMKSTTFVWNENILQKWNRLIFESQS